VEWIRQRSDRDCTVCVVAMLADLPYERVLADNPDYEKNTDQTWIDYIRGLGFEIRRTQLLNRGYRHFAIVDIGDGVPTHCHAIAIDETGNVFDPETRAPAPGTLEISWYKTAPRHLSFVHVLGGKKS
jgi:hypothetical protein